MSDKIYICGMGAISSAGAGIDKGYSAIKHGRDGITPLHLFDSQLKITPLCAQVDIPYTYDSVQTYRTLQLAESAVDEALLSMPDRQGISIGVVSSTTIGGICSTEKVYNEFLKDPALLARLAQFASIHEPSVLSSRICERIKGQGFHTLSTACSTGLHAIGMAKRLIDKGVYDACIAVGSDALSFLTIRGFASLTLLDPNGCRPFDKSRAGISLGEGAGAMLLVKESLTGRCKHKPSAIVSGWGASADCYHMTAPHPQGEGAQASVVAALKEADIEEHTIDFIAAHGTGTPDNDKAEIKAMQTVFGTLPPFCSMKRSIGHTLAASGILESVYAIRALHDNYVPPTTGFQEQDPEIGYSPVAKTHTMKHILKNSFGFGGNNASMIFSKVE
jgi:3-oxoacyl-[acyl-carrier-protein] synthase-1